MSEKLSLVDIVGVGINSTDTVIRLPRFPAFDSKMQVKSSEVLPGGQVATAIVACQRWGLRTRYVGKIGDDDAGRLQQTGLSAEGVEAHWLQVPQCASQKAFILVDELSGERTILWQRDARLDIGPEELLPEWITEARLLHVDGHPSAPAVAAARWARNAGIVVTSDLDNLYDGVEALLECVDYAMCSSEFPARLTGVENLLESLPLMKRRFGCKVTGATLGSEGVLAWDGERFHYCPGFVVEATDTTGAGDIFHAGFAHGLLRNLALPDILEFSCAAAALSCTAPGARGGIRPIAEIEKLMAQGPRSEHCFDRLELEAYSERARSYSANAGQHPTAAE